MGLERAFEDGDWLDPKCDVKGGLPSTTAGWPADGHQWTAALKMIPVHPQPPVHAESGRPLARRKEKTWVGSFWGQVWQERMCPGQGWASHQGS